MTSAVHVAGLAVLAAELDRDMVLPQARHSRYSLCNGLPYPRYHSIDSLRAELELPESSRIHLWTEFQAYAYERARRGQGIIAQSMSVNRLNVTIGDGSDRCAKPILRQEPKFATFEHHEEAGTNEKADRIREVAESIQADTLLVNWSEVERVFAPEDLSVDFSQEAHDTADRLLQSFGKTLAIHWRQVNRRAGR